MVSTAPERGHSSDPPVGGGSPAWNKTTAAKLAAGAGVAGLFLTGLLGCGDVRGGDDEAPSATSTARAVTSESPGAGEVVSLDWDSYFAEPAEYPDGAFASMDEQARKFTFNQSLVDQSTDYLEAAVAVIEAGGDPSGIPEEYVATIATSRNNDAVAALNSLAQKIVDNKPEGSSVTWMYVGATPNELEVVGDYTSTVFRDSEGLIQTQLVVAVVYIPDGADASQEIRAEYAAEYSTAVVAQYGSNIVFDNP